MNITKISKLQEAHVAGWNERDAGRREAILSEIYANDIQMHDKDFTLYGLKAVSDFIGKLLNDDPDFSFTAQKPIENVQKGARLYGEISTSGTILYSMDFFIFEGHKVAQLYVFMDN